MRRRKMALLEIEGLTKRFFGLVAVNNVDFQIEEGELVALIGPNGSGKTTLFHCVTGFLKPDAGKVYYRGQDITCMPAHKVALLGMSRTFQLARIFPKLTLLDNLLLAVQQHQEESLVGRFLMTKKVRQFEQEATERAEEILDFVELRYLRDVPAENLGYGQLKLFIFGMALMPDPDLILLDEPSAATDAAMVSKMKERMVELNKAGKTIFFVEHDMKVVMDVAQRIIVLDHGHKIAEGTPKVVRNDERVIEAYFGRRGENH
jgi:ABC-type branched-subunit amino acid transport system ATPase component